MEYRSLKESDSKGLIELILSIYHDDPLSMWFDSEPKKDELIVLFGNKRRQQSAGNASDIIALDGKKIIGECEIVRVGIGLGLIGVIIQRSHRRKNVGNTLLKIALNDAKKLGIIRVYAEISLRNDTAIKFFEKMGFSRASPAEANLLRKAPSSKTTILAKDL